MQNIVIFIKFEINFKKIFFKGKFDYDYCVIHFFYKIIDNHF
jgi:hypothetical protein